MDSKVTSLLSSVFRSKASCPPGTQASAGWQGQGAAWRPHNPRRSGQQTTTSLRQTQVCGAGWDPPKSTKWAGFHRSPAALANQGGPSDWGSSNERTIHKKGQKNRSSWVPSHGMRRTTRGIGPIQQEFMDDAASKYLWNLLAKCLLPSPRSWRQRKEKSWLHNFEGSKQHNGSKDFSPAEIGNDMMEDRMEIFIL